MNWTPCTPLTAEPDYWDADQVAIRRRLSGVSQGIEDLRAVAVHFKRDPEEAVAAWEAHARAADDDGMATFNAFVREWQQTELWSSRVAPIVTITANAAPAIDTLERLNRLLSGLSFIEYPKHTACLSSI